MNRPDQILGFPVLYRSFGPVPLIETRPERLLPAAVDVETRHRRGVCLVHGVLREECVASIEAVYELQRRSA